MRSKPIALLLAAALLAGSASLAMAGERGGSGPRDERGGMCDRWDGPRHDGNRGGRHGDGWRDGPGRGDFGMGHGDFGGFGMRHGGFGPGFWMDLDLDATQKSKIVDILTNQFKTGLEARMELMDARKKLEDLRENDSVANADLIAANEAVGLAKGKLEVVQKSAREDIKKVLTPEQVKQLEERRDAPPSGDRKDDRRGDDGRPDRPGRHHGPRG